MNVKNRSKKSRSKRRNVATRTSLIETSPNLEDSDRKKPGKESLT